MTIRNDALRLMLAASALLAIGCDGGPPPSIDGGDEGPDAGPSDTTRPQLIEATPEDGSAGVPRSSAFSARFSEAMREGAGTVRVRVEGEDFDVTPTRTDDGLRLAPDGGWPAASEVEVRIDDDFLDLAGNALDRPYVFRFTTADDAAPTVVSSDPAEGASDVSVRIGVVRIRFSEPMDQAAGSITLEGEPGTIDPEAAWSPLEVSYRISGLVHDTDYRLVLDGFRDRQGNLLDPESLGDGAIDFSTGSDDEPPQAVASTPVEGQVDVLIEGLGGSIEVVFDEAMDTSRTSAPITVGSTTTDATIAWTDDRTARFDVAAALRTEATSSLDLRGLTDVRGNALATGPYLGDGRLDFTTGVDAFVPFVVASDPAEDATAVPIPVREVTLAFSEAMDESLSDVIVTDDRGGSATVTGTWRAGGTVLALPGSAFGQGRLSHVDVRALQDLSGSPIAATHPYLGDGVLDFTIAAPTGESCEQPLGIENATAVVGSRYEFTITGAQRTRNNGSVSCDPGGIETDAVVHYRKTTPALSDPSGEGRALRILTFNTTNRANVEVFSGVCDPRDAGADAARVVCARYHDDWDQLLDLPAGDYYIWFSNGSGSFDVRLAIEEVAGIPEGERCEDPYDATSGAAIYTPPATPGEPHVWVLPPGPHNSLDIAESNPPFGAFECSDEHSGDVVVRYDKVGADSVLDVVLTSSSSSTTAQVVVGACRPGDAAASRGPCLPSVGSGGRRLSVAGPAGPVYVWLAPTFSGNVFGGGRVEIRELPAPSVPGSSCATAIPITPGASVPITPTYDSRYFAPTCFGPSADVTWYSFDTTATLTHVRTTGAGVVGLVDAATGKQSSCASSATSTPLAHFAPVGSSLCVAVQSHSAVSALSIESIDYEGAGVRPPTALGIARPSLDGTQYEGFNINSTWMALTPTTIWQAMGTAGLISAPRAGSAPASIRFDVDGAVLQHGVAAGAELWGIGLNGSPRLARLTDASGAWSPVAWDRGSDYSRPRTSGTSPGTSQASTRVLAWHGDELFAFENISSATFAPRENIVYRYSRTAPGAAVQLGRIDALYDIDAAVADDDWLYLAARTSSTASTIGIYRVARAALTGGALASPELVVSTGAAIAPMVLDGNARYLYFAVAGDIHVLEGPGSASPRALGMILDRASASDSAMDIDRTTGALYAYSRHEDAGGAWYRLDP